MPVEGHGNLPRAQGNPALASLFCLALLLARLHSFVTGKKTKTPSALYWQPSTRVFLNDQPFPGGLRRTGSTVQVGAPFWRRRNRQNLSGHFPALGAVETTALLFQTEEIQLPASKLLANGAQPSRTELCHVKRLRVLQGAGSNPPQPPCFLQSQGARKESFQRPICPAEREQPPPPPKRQRSTEPWRRWPAAFSSWRAQPFRVASLTQTVSGKQTPGAAQVGGRFSTAEQQAQRRATHKSWQRTPARMDQRPCGFAFWGFRGGGSRRQ